MYPGFGLICLIVVVSSESSTTTSGPSVKTIYSNGLSMNSPRFVRPNGISNKNYYYDALQLIIWTNGKYSLRSNSSIDTYGCLYRNSFDPSNVYRNLLICDDNSGGDQQFLIIGDLQSNITYVLVVTTYQYLTIGNYSMIAIGPSLISVYLINPTTYSSSTTTAATTSGSSPTISWYSGDLKMNSPTFVRPGSARHEYYRYESIQLMTYVGGYYKFRSNSSFDTYGCLYTEEFNSLEPYLNELVCDDSSGGTRQFLIDYFIETRGIYVLVVTTPLPGIQGKFSVSATGLGFVLMDSITPVESTANGELTSKSRKFVRPGGSSTNYYYNAIEFHTYTTSGYAITSRSSLNTYGCIYNDSFDSSHPLINLVVCDDDSAGDLQFLITYGFEFNRKYILVVTTSTTDSTGSYSIVVTGAASVNMTSITYSLLQ